MYQQYEVILYEYENFSVIYRLSVKKPLLSKCLE